MAIGTGSFNGVFFNFTNTTFLNVISPVTGTYVSGAYNKKSWVSTPQLSYSYPAVKYFLNRVTNTGSGVPYVMWLSPNAPDSSGRFYDWSNITTMSASVAWENVSGSATQIAVVYIVPYLP